MKKPIKKNKTATIMVRRPGEKEIPFSQFIAEEFEMAMTRPAAMKPVKPVKPVIGTAER